MKGSKWFLFPFPTLLEKGKEFTISESMFKIDTHEENCIIIMFLKAIYNVYVDPSQCPLLSLLQ